MISISIHWSYNWWYFVIFTVIGQILYNILHEIYVWTLNLSVYNIWYLKIANQNDKWEISNVRWTKHAAGLFLRHSLGGLMLCKANLINICQSKCMFISNKQNTVHSMSICTNKLQRGDKTDFWKLLRQNSIQWKVVNSLKIHFVSITCFPPAFQTVFGIDTLDSKSFQVCLLYQVNGFINCKITSEK